jgi:hypothetical protein
LPLATTVVGATLSAFQVSFSTTVVPLLIELTR